MELDFAETDSKDLGQSDQEHDVLIKDLAELKLTDDILNDICLEIKDKVEDLKFLGSNMKDVQWKEVEDSSQFFKKLKNLVDEEMFSIYVAELLFRIKRYDLLAKIGICEQKAQDIFQKKSVLDPLIKLLFNILDTLDEDKANDIANKLSQLFSPSKHSMDLRVLFSELISDENLKPSFLQTLHSKLVNQNQSELAKELELITAANWVSKSPNDISLVENDESLANVKKAEVEVSASSEVSDDFYDMSRVPCGICVIINVEKFNMAESEDTFRDRIGTNFDRDKLQSTFEKFGFKVEVYNDLTSVAIKTLLNELANTDHKNYSCFVCCILSHGKEQLIVGADNKPLDIYDDIIYRFSAIKCKSLANKPKLFFIQACQGDALMRPAILDVEEDGWETSVKSENKNLPSIADFLLSQATVPKFKAFRFKKSGSIFISCLTEELSKNGHKCDILDILREVNKKVAKEDVINKKDEKIKKQMPCATFTLRKKLIFKIKGENV